MTLPVDDLTQTKMLQARVVNGVEPTRYRVPYRNIGHLLTQQAKASGIKGFLIYYDADGTRSELTYADFSARVQQTANYLYEDLGVRRGDRVATLAHNHSHTAILYFACWMLGAAIAPQNIAEDDRRIAFILRNSDAKVLFVREDYLERAETIVHSTDEGLGAANIERIIQMGGEATDRYPLYENEVANLPTQFLADSSLPKGNESLLNVPSVDTPSLEDEALLVYTSGTTGAPKGVVLTQYNLLVDAQGISSWNGITGNQRMMCVLPIHHVNGIVVTLVTPLFVGGSTVLNRQFSVSTFWRRVVSDKVHVVSVVPTLLQFLLEAGVKQRDTGNPLFGEGINRRGLTHFRHFICGAGTLAMALVRDFEDLFGYPVIHGYGLSETTCYSCFMPIDLTADEHFHWLQDHGYPTIGCPIEPNEMGIFDASGSGQQLGPGERGEICVRGHNVMRGYYQRPDANAETFKFGWFRTGDEGFYELDERGRTFFFISGRLKELINRGGVKFSPFDIEEVLLGYAGVKVALAVAFKNTYYGEEVGAYIVPHEGVTLDPDALIAFARTKMSYEKSPKVVVFGTEIPVTSTGKYQRLRLQDLFAEWEGTQFRG